MAAPTTGDITAALATLSAAGWTVTNPSAYTGGPLASPGPIGSTVPSSGAFTTLSASAAVALSPASANVVLSPTGTGVVTVNPAAAGTINNCSVGVVTPAIVKASDLQTARTDISGTPGNGTANTARGRAAFSAAGSSVVVTNSLVTATSTVLCQMGGADVTALTCRVTAGAGSFTVTANSAATAATPFDFLVIN